MNLDPRIGVLNSGKFYAFVNGYDQPEFVGTLNEVEVKLGLPRSQSNGPLDSKLTSWDVKLCFQYPAWDEIDGIEYLGVVAKSKSEAITRARRQAQNDGHAVSGRGRYWFAATVVNN